MKIFNLPVLFLSSSSVIFSACGPVKDMSEMHDSTLAMNKTTTEMNGTTSKMAVNTNEMLKKTSDMADKMTTMDEHMLKLYEQIKLMGEDTHNMAGKMDKMTDGMDKMGGQMSNMDKNMTDMHGTMKGMAGDTRNMSGKMDNMNAGMDKMGSQMSNMDAHMTDMHGTMKGMADDTHGMASKMDKVAGGMDKMSGQMSNMDSHMTDMHGTMKGMGTDIKSMSGKMDGMSSAVDKMASKMDGVSAGMEKMATLMSNMDKNMTDMGYVLNLTHSDLRLIFTGQHRMESLEAMSKSEDQATKIGYAAEYMISQTYQSWNARIDSKKTRLDLMGMAIPDFFQKLAEYIKDHQKFDPSKTDPGSMDLYALSAVIDYANTIQADGLQGSKEPLVTIYSMMVDGLRQDESVQSGKVDLKSLPVYQQEVLAHKQDAIYLLRVRQNFLKGVAYSLASSKENSDPKSRFGSIFNVFKARILRSSWNANLDSKGIAEIDVIATALNLALDTEEVLRSLGIDPMTNSNVRALLRSMNIRSGEDETSKAATSRLNAALERMNNLEKQ